MKKDEVGFCVRKRDYAFRGKEIKTGCLNWNRGVQLHVCRLRRRIRKAGGLILSACSQIADGDIMQVVWYTHSIVLSIKGKLHKIEEASPKTKKRVLCFIISCNIHSPNFLKRQSLQMHPSSYIQYTKVYSSRRPSGFKRRISSRVMR